MKAKAAADSRALPPLPAYMERIRRHLLAERGMSEAKATATAIATCHVFCRSGQSPNLPVEVNASSRAEACAAVAELQAMKQRRPAPPPEPAQEAPSRPSSPPPRPARLEPTRVAEVTDKPWDGSASRFSDEQYARSCVLDRGPSVESTKERYSLPVREPEGTLNRNAVHSAAAMISKVKGASAEQLRSAARRLVGLYRRLRETPPDGLVRLAGLAATAGAVGATSKEEQRAGSEDGLDEVETDAVSQNGHDGRNGTPASKPGVDYELVIEQRSAPDLLVVEGRKLRGRVEEWIALERRDLDLPTRVLHVRRIRSSRRTVELGPQGSKSWRQRRQVPLRQVVVEALAAMPTRIDSPLVFPAPKGGFLESIRFLERYWQPAVEAAGVEYFAPKDLRHVYASESLAAGVTQFTLSRRMGTSSAEIERTYGHLVQDSAEVELRLLDAYDAAQAVNG